MGQNNSKPVASNPDPNAKPPSEEKKPEPSVSSEQVLEDLKKLKEKSEIAKSTMRAFKVDNKGCPMELRDALNYLDTLKTQFKPFDEDWHESDTYHLSQKAEYKRLIAVQNKLIESLQRKYAQLI